MRRYLLDKNIEVKKEYSKHNYKQLINRMKGKLKFFKMLNFV